jgi:DMSO/TMAO reductase YedYZ molybdopterin-dependent catalytic subunit
VAARHEITRREFLASAVYAAALARLQPPSSEARLVGTVPLYLPGRPVPPLERLIGSGLDARLATDLSTLDASNLVTPNDRYYVRTAAPRGLAAGNLRPPADSSVPGTEVAIPIRGRVESPASVTLADIERAAVKAGPYVMECAGNADPTNYGLLSAASWEGARLLALIDRVKAASGSYRILVNGLDDPGPAQSSVPGASWIFSRDQLERAILAVRMNGAPLPRDHGFPVRLIVPGWYGCACIKWVDAIELVPDDSQPTSQMWEFARRTHQNGLPERARDYEPPVIDTAAMPIRIEKWSVAGRLEYRIVGIIWGGTKPTNALSIRFRAGDAWTKVDDCPLPKTMDTWTLWTHTWKPPDPGRYQIVLKVDDPSVRTRRLDLFFYTREVEISEL